jgi:hypothetical protein
MRIATPSISQPSSHGLTREVEALAMLTELVSLADQIERLSERAFGQLGARPTVTAHLGQARTHLSQLHRCLVHAEGTMAYNSALSSR